MKNILITGGTGYLGTKLIQKLAEKEFNIVCFSKNPKTGISGLKNVRYLEGDITDEESVRDVFASNNFDCVIHLAAIMELGEEMEKLSSMIKTNVGGTMNILQNMVKYGPKNIIFSSSMKVIGIPEKLPVDENHPQAPINLYDLSKKHSEELIRFFSEKYGLNSHVIRLPSLFGGGGKSGAIYNFVKNALRNNDLMILLTKPIVWDILHVFDAAMAIEHSLERIDKTSSYNLFNVDYGEPVEIQEIAKKIVAFTNSNSKIIVHGNAKSYPFYFDNKKTKSELGIKLPKLDDRLREFIEEVKSEDYD